MCKVGLRLAALKYSIKEKSFTNIPFCAERRTVKSLYFIHLRQLWYGPSLAPPKASIHIGIVRSPCIRAKTLLGDLANPAWDRPWKIPPTTRQ